jgi:hypothetical protein
LIPEVGRFSRSGLDLKNLRKALKRIKVAQSSLRSAAKWPPRSHVAKRVYLVPLTSVVTLCAGIPDSLDRDPPKIDPGDVGEGYTVGDRSTQPRIAIDGSLDSSR